MVNCFGISFPGHFYTMFKILQWWHPLYFFPFPAHKGIVMTIERAGWDILLVYPMYSLPREGLVFLPHFQSLSVHPSQVDMRNPVGFWHLASFCLCVLQEALTITQIKCFRTASSKQTDFPKTHYKQKQLSIKPRKTQHPTHKATQCLCTWGCTYKKHSFAQNTLKDQKSSTSWLALTEYTCWRDSEVMADLHADFSTRKYEDSE